MRKFRIGLIIFSVMIIIGELVLLDYSNLALSKNLGPCLTSMGMMFVIISQVFELRNDKKKQSS